MLRKRIFLTVFVATALVVAIASGAGAWTHDGKKTSGFVVGFVNGYFGNTWRAQFVDDAQRVADDFIKKGIFKEFIVQNVNDDVTKQIVQLNSLIDRGVDCILINPVSAEALAPIIRRAKQKNILIVNVDDPAAYEGTYSVCGDHRTFFGIQVKWLAHTIGGEGKIVAIEGLAGNSCDIVRRDEAHKILAKYPGIKVMAEVPGGWNETKAQEAMTNFLATYPQIDAVLTQDIMAEGIMRAYDIVGKPYPPMTGDYTYGFFRKWEKHPELKSIGVTYNPGIGADAVMVAGRLLMGWKFKDGALGPNQINPKLINTITVPPAYVVTRTAEPEAPWVEGVSSWTKRISLDEALKIGESKTDNDLLDGMLTNEEVDALFVKE
jgi:ribose transport system substrate-binding protein